MRNKDINVGRDNIDQTNLKISLFKVFENDVP